MVFMDNNYNSYNSFYYTTAFYNGEAIFKYGLKPLLLIMDEVKSTTPYKIPPISHNIWLTNPDNPKEISDKAIENLIKKISFLDRKTESTTCDLISDMFSSLFSQKEEIITSPWEHILWTNDKSLLPKTTKKLEGLNIKIKDISEIKDQIKTYDLINEAIAKNNFGISADLLREEVINIYGGFYSDLNYQITHHPDPMMKVYDFIGGDHMNRYNIENSFFAAKPHHPILERAIEATLYNINNREFLYNKRSADYITMPIFANSVLKNFGIDGNKDILVFSARKPLSTYPELSKHIKELELKLQLAQEEDKKIEYTEVHNIFIKMEEYAESHPNDDPDNYFVKVSFGFDEIQHSWLE